MTMPQIQTFRKITILVSISFSALCCFAQTIYSVSGTINGCKAGKIYLSEIKGKQISKTDSATLNNDCAFSFPMPVYTGVLRISAGDSNYSDIIFNNENTHIHFSSARLSSGAEIIESSENKIFFNYLSEIKTIDDTADALINKGQQLYDTDPSGNASALKKLMKRIDELRKKKNSICFEISNENKTLYVSKIIKAGIIPDYAEYMKKKDAAPYPDEAAFLREHYFDYTDFSDSTLLNSVVFFKKCGDYFAYFANPPSTKAYNDCIDFILVRAQADKNVYNYIINTLTGTFEHSKWEDVYLHIVEKYNETNTCTNEAMARDMKKTSAIIKMLKPGNKAPDIIIPDTDGKTRTLDSLKSKYVLIMFWASWCEYCYKAMPDIKSIYETYHSKGLEIFAVSCDSIKDAWQAASEKYDMPWINTCDLKGYKSEAINNYYIWQTPTFFLLDSNKKIIAKPFIVAKLSEELEGIDWGD